ncbi:MAG TPA: inositol monophosphatase family protein [Vicinamibacteria bacterium]|nr:inositol monophosphatase family protein [Vicinamibacteria bacterium]
MSSDRWVALAAEAVLMAGGMQKERYGASDLDIQYKGEIDIVTAVDRACEAAVVGLIRGRFPDHDIVAEETDLGRTGSRYVWFVDPLDGTTNFAHGYPFFCCSVALTVDGQPVAGAVYDCIKEELFTAERGGGAHLNGRRLRVTERHELLRSLLVTGFPYDMRLDLGAALALFNRFMGVARAIRRDGAAALDLSYVAAGRADGFWEEKLHPWDVLAGALLITEAGGVITRFDGSPLGLTADEVVAGNPVLHAAMLEVLRDHPAAG